MSSGERDSGVRLADLVAAFSLATDLGLGLPMDHVMRSWRIAAALGDEVGVEAIERGNLYYVVSLAWVGCVADTPEVAALFGDDIAFRGDSFEIDFAGLPLLGFMLRHVGAGSPPLHRLRLGARLLVTGGAAVQRGLMSHCLTTASLAERFELGDDVCSPLQHVFGVVKVFVCVVGPVLALLSGEAESAGEVDLELVEGLFPAPGAGAEVAASLVGDVSGAEA